MKPLLAIKRVLTRVMRAIARCIALVIGFLIYFLLIGPYAIVMRVAAGDLLEKSPDPKQPSYWHRARPHRGRPERPF